MRAIPAVTKAPLPLMQSQGVIKTIVRRIGRKILERENLAAQEDPEDHPQTPRAKDIISVLLRARRLGKKTQERLSDEQILDNVLLGFLSVIPD